jgi:FkbM family methyltransferase
VQLDPIDPAHAREWKAWVRGPRSLELSCAGSPLARATSLLHQRWPLQRGHTRLSRVLGGLGVFADVPFRCPGGVTVHLNMGSYELLHLAGRLPTEPLEVSLLSRLVRQGDIVVDIGAHMGLYIAHLLGRLGSGGRMHAFEPSPTNIAFLRRAFRDASNLSLHELALSDYGGEGSMAREEDSMATLEPADGKSGTPVMVTTLAEALREESTSSHWLLKMDVEGHEARFLRGGERLFDAGLRPTVMLEYLPNLSNAAREELDATLRRYFGARYHWYAICQSHGELHPFPTSGASHEVWNLLLVPDEELGRVQAAFVGSLPPARIDAWL